MTMKYTVAIQISVILLLSVFAECSDIDVTEEAGKKFLEKLDQETARLNTENTQASWDYESNITDHNLQRQLEVSAKVAEFTKEAWKEVIKYPWKTYKDPDLRRKFEKYSVLGAAALSPEKYERLGKVVKDMQGVYGKAKICDFHNSSKCDLHLEPEITELFAKSRDPEELSHLWTEWRKASGRPVRQMFSEFVKLSNEAAKLNNFSDASESWLKDYESDDFTEQVEVLWQQVRPLYMQLHAYVRRRLRELYGEEIVSKTGPIPAHLLGNMWAQTWTNIANDTVPYPEKPNTDITPEMIAQKYTPLKMFKVAEEFFTSLGLSEMPDTFWKNSIIEKPDDGRDLICHASAWDFYDGKDFRIKQCTRVAMEDLRVVHHEMGHIQYYLQYKNQPFIYKEGSNPGFHEAVGDVMALSVSTPKHLKKIGLLKELVDDQEAEINQLFGMALDKVAFLPFAYLLDQWRWGVFQGKITESDYNCKWWELREQYQGIQPPRQRDEEDFDPGAKYHIVASVPYIRYFVSFIIQFQFHRSLCIAAGEFDPQNPTLKPLHKCDIYQNKKAGELLGNMLKMGSSKPWPDAMEVITGQRKMDAGALLEYFSILQTWLERENARTGEYIGWEPTSNAHEGERVHYYELEEPGDTSEDDYFGYSYAELVPQNDMFDFLDYRHKTEPWFLHPILRRSTQKQFEVNKNVNLKSKRPQNYDKIIKLTDREGLKTQRRKLHQKTSQKDTGMQTLKEVIERETETENDGKPLPESTFYRRALDKTEPEIMYKMEDKPMKKGELDSKQPSTITRLLYSLGSSLGKPHVLGTSNGGQSPANSGHPESDIMWNAEMMRVKAENMLKYFDVKSNPSETTYPLLTDNKIMPTYGMDKSIAPKSRFMGRKDNLRSHLRPKARRHVQDRKKLQKKSFMHYHYNVRTPVYYNAVVLKKPVVSAWIEDDVPVKYKVVHQPQQESSEVILPAMINNKYNNKWKSIKLVPVDQYK